MPEPSLQFDAWSPSTANRQPFACDYRAEARRLEAENAALAAEVKRLHQILGWG